MSSTVFSGIKNSLNEVFCGLFLSLAEINISSISLTKNLDRNIELTEVHGETALERFFRRIFFLENV